MTDIERACEHRCAMHPCKHICEYAALSLIGARQNHEEIVKEYTGFLEVGK